MSPPETGAPRPGEGDEAREESSQGRDRSNVDEPTAKVNGWTGTARSRARRHGRPCSGALAYLAAIRIRWFNRRPARPCFESQETWATRIGVDVKTIRRWEQQLKKAGLVHVEQHPNRRILTAIETDNAVRVEVVSAETDNLVRVPGQPELGDGQRCPPSRGVDVDEQNPSPCPPDGGRGLDEPKHEAPPEGVHAALWALTRPLREAGLRLDHAGSWIIVASWLKATPPELREETVDALLWRLGRGGLEPGGVVGVARKGNRERRYGATAVLSDPAYASFKAELEGRELAAMPADVRSALDVAVPVTKPQETDQERLERLLHERDEQLARLRADAADSVRRTA